ncbi:S-layer homology domain-containing protein [Gorillibacterium massiliense]|uniref:S-layer homology domain-containing protein n=1 Tax=Gorillibacterium massiliense TaxID=1280390 RepID=UPI00059263E1|nr:S-layer homology domain-containing protein [Gorillibacterium massiliense]
MKSLRKKWTSTLLIFCILIGLLPAIPAFAASGTISITSPTTNDLITTQTINVKANVSSDIMARISEIRYEVYNETTKVSSGEITNKPATQTGQFEVTFTDVNLTEGTNRITLIVGDVNKIKSAPVTVIYTPVSNISGLKADGTSFSNVPSILPSPGKTSFQIEGDAPNAKEVYAIIDGDSTPIYGSVRSGHFYYTVEDSNIPMNRSVTNFRLTPGDNKVTFYAKNDTKIYRTDRTFIYDNGKSFAFDAKMNEVGQSNVQALKNLTLFQPEGNTRQVHLTAKLKVDTPNGTVASSVYGELNVPGLSPETITLSTLPKDSTWSKSGQYDVYDFDKVITLPSGRNQTIQLRFIDSANSAFYSETTFNFEYLPKTVAAITSAARVVDVANNTEAELIDSYKGTNNINMTPLYVNAYVNTYVSGIDVNVNGVKLATSKIGSLQTGTNGKYYRIDLSALNDGVNTLEIIPKDSTSALVPEGARTYALNITSVPYVILTNMYNGMVITNPDVDLKVDGLAPVLSGRVINLPTSEYANVKLYLNGEEVSIAANPIKTADGTFNFLLPTAKIKEGNNSINIKLYQNGVVVTETTNEFFKYADNAPQFIFATPEAPAEGNKFVKGQADDMYVTNEQYVRINGQFLSKNTKYLKVTVKKTGEDGKELDTYDIVPDIIDQTKYQTSSGIEVMPAGYSTKVPAGEPTRYIKSINSSDGTFQTTFIKLQSSGNTIIEFEIQNSSGLAITKAITITREPKDYTIVSPTTTRNAKNQDQANVNANFVDIDILAESADSVLFGKEAATRDTTNTDLFHFRYFGSSGKGLSAGSNNVKFTIVRGSQKSNGTLIVYNANTSIQGAQYITALGTSMKVFNGNVVLSFPKSTLLKRSDTTQPDPMLTEGRKILFGIADSADGRVDKLKYPSITEGAGNSNFNARTASAIITGSFMLTEDSGRFRKASSLIWIDAGSISSQSVSNSDQLQDAMTGSGKDPYVLDSEFFNRRSNEDVVPTNRGTLTLSYDPSVRSDSWNYVTVLHFDPTTKRWANLGGVVDNKKNTITVPFETFGYYQVFYMFRSFDDVISHPYARNAMDTLYSKGYMNKKDGKNLFEPYNSVTRGEFITMLVKIFEIPLNYDGASSFSDVFKVDPYSEGLYEYKYIETAARAGIIRGTTGGTFMPRETITREEAAIMIAKAGNMKLNTDLDKSLATLQKSFTDAASIESYARPAVEAITKAKLVSGIQNVLVPGQKITYRFAPKSSFTRADAAVIMMNVLKQQKKIPK